MFPSLSKNTNFGEKCNFLEKKKHKPLLKRPIYSILSLFSRMVRLKFEIAVYITLHPAFHLFFIMHHENIYNDRKNKVNWIKNPFKKISWNFITLKAGKKQGE